MKSVQGRDFDIIHGFNLQRDGHFVEVRTDDDTLLIEAERLEPTTNIVIDVRVSDMPMSQLLEILAVVEAHLTPADEGAARR